MFTIAFLLKQKVKFIFSWSHRQLIVGTFYFIAKEVACKSRQNSRHSIRRILGPIESLNEHWLSAHSRCKSDCLWNKALENISSVQTTFNACRSIIIYDIPFRMRRYFVH